MSRPLPCETPMTHAENFDPAQAGCRQIAPTRDGEADWSEAECHREVEAFLLETKSGDPREALWAFLQDMAGEMRAQFESFRKLRIAADTVAKANAEGASSEDAAAKLARADIKAALDAMSLIIRTLEKVDALQRQIARDAELETERQADGAGYEDAKKRLLAIIEQRVTDRVEAVLGERERAAADPSPGGGNIAGSDRGG